MQSAIRPPLARSLLSSPQTSSLFPQLPSLRTSLYSSKRTILNFLSSKIHLLNLDTHDLSPQDLAANFSLADSPTKPGLTLIKVPFFSRVLCHRPCRTLEMLTSHLTWRLLSSAPRLLVHYFISFSATTAFSFPLVFGDPPISRLSSSPFVPSHDFIWPFPQDIYPFYLLFISKTPSLIPLPLLCDCGYFFNTSCPFIFLDCWCSFHSPTSPMTGHPYPKPPTKTFLFDFQGLQDFSMSAHSSFCFISFLGNDDY